MKENIKKFTGGRSPNLLRNAGWAKLGLVILAGLAVNVGRALPPSGSFANPIVITDIWGTTSVDNTGYSPGGSPSIAGFPPNAPVWFQWKAPSDGEVELDTIGSAVDTVLAVFTGTNASGLNQVAANDDLFPVNSSYPQINYSSSADYVYAVFDGFYPITYYILQPYYGPSGLRFNASKDTTYYFAVDSKSGTGFISLTWAYHSSGVFRFAAEDQDASTGMPVYQCAETESWRPSGDGDVAALTVVETYYDYNVPGVLVTVTRVAGSSGRVLVDYQTEDGDALPALPLNNQPAFQYADYYPVSGTLVFDDFEMSKTIFIPIISDYGLAELNRDFGVVLTSAALDGSESSDVSPARLDASYSTVMVKILDVDTDPNGPSSSIVVDTNTVPPTTNVVFTLVPTNAIFNFEKANYRVPEDVNDYWGSTPVTIYVARTGTNEAGFTLNYRFNDYLGNDRAGHVEQNCEFPLQPGSDYATPTPPNAHGLVLGRNPPDFDGSSGTISFGSKDWIAKKITFTVNNDDITEFNEDFRVQFYQEVKTDEPTLHGMVSETTVTIMFDDQDSPAGSVDEYYNPDFGHEMAPATGTEVYFPGTDGEVYGLALQTNDETVIVGDFFTYNLATRNCIARINTDGSLDTSFNPGDGANDFISCLVLTPTNQPVIGGGFTAFNGQQRNFIARLNSNGSLDTSFNPHSGDGANDTIRAMAQQSDGKIIIGGDFTSYSGTPRNYIARLNADGSLDTSFDPGTSINASVHAVSLQNGTSILLDRTASGTDVRDDQSIDLGPSTGGALTVDYDMLGQPDDMRVYYGDSTNGFLIYDTGFVSYTGHFVLPFGPTNGLTTNKVTIVMNQTGGQPGTLWSYTASVEAFGAFQLTIGGEFTSVGGISGRDHIARLFGDGSVDATFDPGAGINGTVYAVATQPDGKVVAGGEFSKVNGQNINRIVRLKVDGSVDDNFFAGTGPDGAVQNITVQSGGTMYVGGTFTSFNGTHRLGFTRLNTDGTVDTTFLDTAYNQFAGLPRTFFGDPLRTVFTSGVQSDGKVMIGGSFNRVGGGQSDDPDVRPESVDYNNLTWEGYFGYYPERKTRAGVRNRNNVARLIGGSTPGPGNVGLLYDTYSVNRSQSALYVSLLRANGTLGPASANFFVTPGLAQSGVDYNYNSIEPLYWIRWLYFDFFTPLNPVASRMHSDGLFGTNGFVQDVYGANWTVGVATKSGVTVTILNNTNLPGNLGAQFQLANPSGADQFYLGGENIPLGVALGMSAAPLTIVDDHHQSGVFGFASPNYIGTNANSSISVIRTNGTYGQVSLNYATITNGSTAILNSDYRAASGTLIFGNGVTNRSFNVQILNSNYISSLEKFVNLQLSGLNPPVNGVAALGLTNAVLRIINPNYQGYLSFTATNYATNLSAGALTITVTRTIGNKGSLTVQCATTNGTASNAAINGVDYVGSTNTLQWNNGEVSPRTVTIPLINNGTLGTNKQFRAFLFNPTLNGTNWPSLFVAVTNNAITNATLVISNNNSYGTFQFSAPVYLVNENGLYTTITVIRTGSTNGSPTVQYATTNGTAFAGTNYLSTSGTLSFAPGQISAGFTVPILDDGVTNPPPFFFKVSLFNPTVGATLGSPATATNYIVDAESYNRPPGSSDSAFNPPDINGDVLALALQPNGQFIAGGNFTAIGGMPENHVARLDADGTLDSANFLYGLSGANGPVSALAVQSNGRILIGGGFTFVDDVARNFIARLMTDGSLDTSFRPGAGADNAVYAVAETFLGNARGIYVGGAFFTIGGVNRPGIARLNDDGTVDTTFATGLGANDAVYAIAAYPTNSLSAGKVLIGGAFTNFNNFTVGHIARLNVDGSVDTNFDLNLDANDTVRAIAFQADGGILIGGDFTNVNGTALNRIARLNADGSLDTAFASNVGLGANDSVEAIAVQPDNRIVLVGQFTRASGVTRNHITRLLPTGAVDPTINFGSGANGAIHALVIQPNDWMLLIGGAFTEFDSQPHAHLDRLYGGSMAGSGAFEFTSANYQADENGVNAIITVRRTGGTSGTNSWDGSGDVLVNFATSDGTAVAGVNYSNVNVNLDFPAGEVLETVAIPVMDDLVITPPLTVTNTLSNPTPPAGIGDQGISVLTILNDDSAVSFSSAVYSERKNAGTAAIDVVRQGSTNGTATVDFMTTTNGTALIGTDYLPTNATIVFSPGDSNKTIQIPLINNGLPEGNTTVTMLLSNAVGSLLYDPSNATLTIIDTVNAPGELRFATNGYVANEGDGTASITVVRTNGSYGSVSVGYYTVDGTAKSNVNYTTVGGTLTFGGGVTSRSFAVPLIDNSLAQGPVNLSVVLFTNGTSGAALTVPTNATLTIMDNDVGVAFVNATNYANETSGSAPVFVHRIGSAASAFHVDYATTNGTALAGTNYLSTSGTLNFITNETLKVISVPLVRDTNVTGDLTFTVGLFNPSVGVQLALPSTALVVVQDGDAGLSFTNSTFSVLKNAGNAVITVVCSNPGVEPVIVDSNSVPLSVHFSTSDGTALAGLDYVSTNGILLFTNGVATNTFAVPIINNSLVEGNRTFTVSLSNPNPTPPGQLVFPSNQTVTIIDSNTGLKFSSSTYTVLRSGVAATITVLRTAYTDTVSTVDFATTNGTAVAGLDYLSTNGMLIFTNGETSKTFSVMVIAGTTVQPDKSVMLQLSNPTNGTLVAPSAATLIIHDTSGSLVVPAGSTLIYESGPTNGIIDTNENVALLFAFRVSAGTNVNNLLATLLATNGVTSPSGAQFYGSLTNGGHSVSRQFSFTANGTNSQQIAATFRLQDGTNNLGIALFTYTLGTWTTTFYNSNAIIINDYTMASPYPSIINVGGVGGVVIKATVTLTNINHTSPSDIDALLVSPGQQDTLIMAHAGGQNVIQNVTLTFDDAASNSLPHFNLIISGTNKPTAYLPVPDFP